MSLIDDIKDKSEQFGYFRPGFYPIKSRSVMPAMICLINRPFSKEPSVEFVLVKTDCPLPEWEDALTVSEKDYDQVTAKNKEENKEIIEDMATLLKKFTDKGYLPLTKLNQHIHNKAVH